MGALRCLLFCISFLSQESRSPIKLKGLPVAFLLCTTHASRFTRCHFSCSLQFRLNMVLVFYSCTIQWVSNTQSQLQVLEPAYSCKTQSSHIVYCQIIDDKHHVLKMNAPEVLSSAECSFVNASYIITLAHASLKAFFTALENTQGRSHRMMSATAYLTNTDCQNQRHKVDCVIILDQSSH